MLTAYARNLALRAAEKAAARVPRPPRPRSDSYEAITAEGHALRAYDERREHAAARAAAAAVTPPKTKPARPVARTKTKPAPEPVEPDDDDDDEDEIEPVEIGKSRPIKQTPKLGAKTFTARDGSTLTRAAPDFGEPAREHVLRAPPTAREKVVSGCGIPQGLAMHLTDREVLAIAPAAWRMKGSR